MQPRWRLSMMINSRMWHAARDHNIVQSFKSISAAVDRDLNFSFQDSDRLAAGMCMVIEHCMGLESHYARCEIASTVEAANKWFEENAVLQFNGGNIGKSCNHFIAI